MQFIIMSRMNINKLTVHNYMYIIIHQYISSVCDKINNSRCLTEVLLVFLLQLQYQLHCPSSNKQVFTLPTFWVLLPFLWEQGLAEIFLMMFDDIIKNILYVSKYAPVKSDNFSISSLLDTADDSEEGSPQDLSSVFVL